MAWSLFGHSLDRVGVVGSGQVGPDIALFLSRVFVPHGIPVVVHDLRQDALDAGRARIARKLGRAAEAGVFNPAQVRAIQSNLVFTLDRSMLVGCDLVVEAASERLPVKQEIFAELERILTPEAILASNTSHLPPEEVFARLARPERAIVSHFFYPAERNPLVELVPGPRCSVTDWCMKFYEAAGKVPVRVGSRYGFAIDPVFEGLLLASLLLHQQGLPVKTIDAVACRALGLGTGPFTVMNLTGGNPLAREGLRAYHDHLMPWFHSPETLDRKIASGEPWETAGRGETVGYSSSEFHRASEALLGATLGIVCEVVESGIIDPGDLDLAAELGLSMKPPLTLMNEMGPRRVRELVTDYAAAHPGFHVPSSFGPWTIPIVHREARDDVAVLRIKRPRTLNALNAEAYRQLGAHLDAIAADRSVRGVVLTGFGTKAFASGADIGMLASVSGPEEARKLSAFGNAVLRKLETLGKPVVCALNGLSLGGGSELAYACTARIARRGVHQLFGQPEVKLGIIPGAGATQRLPRLIDFTTAWRLLRTGRSISGQEALHLGLIREEVEGDLLDRAVALARTLEPVPLPPPKVPESLPDVDLGGLSRRIDEILRKAILVGATLPLEKALAHEADCFAETFSTNDCRIGLRNFSDTGGSRPAAFIHS